MSVGVSCAGLAIADASGTDTSDPAVNVVPPAGVHAVSRRITIWPATRLATDALSGIASFSKPFGVCTSCSDSKKLGDRDMKIA